jgi:transposase-like protein
MTLLPPAQVEEQLSHVAQQFAQWRQSRTTPRGRIPKPLWAQAIALTQQLPLARVAKQLGLTPQALKRRRDAAGRALAATPPPPFPHFVEVPALPWRTPTTEVEIQRVDGTRLRITYSETSPALAPLLQTFLESR